MRELKDAKPRVLASSATFERHEGPKIAGLPATDRHSFFTDSILSVLTHGKVRFTVKYNVLLTLAFCAATLSGCASNDGGAYVSQSMTDVNLSSSNYQVVKAGAQGTSSGFKILGIPIVSPNYASAKADLYNDVEQPLEGRAVALTNQTEDKSSLNFILFQIPKIKVSADVVEFMGESGTNDDD